LAPSKVDKQTRNILHTESIEQIKATLSKLDEETALEILSELSAQWIERLPSDQDKQQWISDFMLSLHEALILGSDDEDDNAKTSNVYALRKEQF